MKLKMKGVHWQIVAVDSKWWFLAWPRTNLRFLLGMRLVMTTWFGSMGGIGDSVGLGLTDFFGLGLDLEDFLCVCLGGGLGL